MFPFHRFLKSFSPFFLAKTKNELTFWKSLFYYLSVWFLGAVLLGLTLIITGWIYVTPARVAPLLDRIPSFDAVMENGLLVKTGLPSDPFEFEIDGLRVFISSTLTEVPVAKRWTPGIFILRDHALIEQTENIVDKSQSVRYAESPQLKNFHVNNAIMKAKILQAFPDIKRTLGFIIIFMMVFLTGILSLWYLIFSFFWALVVMLASKASTRYPLSYEQSLSFVLYTFFPVILLSFALLSSGIYFPFLTALLFLGMFWYNHLSYHTPGE